MSEGRFNFSALAVRERSITLFLIFLIGAAGTGFVMAFAQAAVFLPGQTLELHPDIAAPEGPLHFAGEHTSLKHAWVEGALESAVRAALEVHRRAV